MKNVIKLAKGSLNNIFQDSFNKILSHQLTHDRSFMNVFEPENLKIYKKLFYFVF